MERQTITPEQQAVIDEQLAYTRSNGVDPQPTPLLEGTNLVIDDDLRICDAFDARVFGSEGGIPWVFAFECCFPIDCVTYVTDRAGPNGETMPIIEPPDEEPTP